MQLFVSISLVLGVAQLLVASPIQKDRIRFNSDGKFKVANFADLHYGEFPGTSNGRATDANSTRVMGTLLDLENPDLVVFTGDLMTADAVLINPTQFIDACFEAVHEKGYKWATTYGNHDNGIATTREEIFATESKYANSYTQHGDASLPGISNYYIPVYPNEGETPLVILWFFDSRGGFDPSGTNPNHVDESVVKWFQAEEAKITETWGKLPAFAFFHIPTIDYKYAQEDMDNRECVGLVEDKVVHQRTDSGFMEALLLSNVLTTFVGHDHGNSWCCDYEYLEICYNRRTGYGGYGKWDRGTRVLELDSTLDLWKNRSNYVRLENGDIVDVFIPVEKP